MEGNVRVQKANKVLGEEIAALREQVALARKRRKQPGTNGAVSGHAQIGPGQAPEAVSQPAAAAPSQETASAEQGDVDQRNARDSLSARIERLELIRSWITTDGDLLPLIAKVAGNVEDKFLRKNVVVSIVLSTIFLIAGWLLSIVATPTIIEHIFRH